MEKIKNQNTVELVKKIRALNRDSKELDDYTQMIISKLEFCETILEEIDQLEDDFLNKMTINSIAHSITSLKNKPF